MLQLSSAKFTTDTCAERQQAGLTWLITVHIKGHVINVFLFVPLHKSEACVCVPKRERIEICLFNEPVMFLFLLLLA